MISNYFVGTNEFFIGLQVLTEETSRREGYFVKEKCLCKMRMPWVMKTLWRRNHILRQMRRSVVWETSYSFRKDKCLFLFCLCVGMPLFVGSTFHINNWANVHLKIADPCYRPISCDVLCCLRRHAGAKIQVWWRMSMYCTRYTLARAVV